MREKLSAPIPNTPNTQILFSDQELLRYSRQIMMPEFDIEGQLSLKQSSVLIIGLGGLGCPAALYLASSGIGTLTICDDDTVELSNLQRQILHYTDNMNQFKTDSAAAKLQNLNPHTCIIKNNQRPDEQNLNNLVNAASAVLDCSDNFTTRLMLNTVCLRHKTPLISAAAAGFNGQLAVFDYRINSPCYACLYPDIDKNKDDEYLSCSETGILAAVTGIIGSTQALEAIKLLSGIGSSMVGKFMIFNGLTLQWQTFQVDKNPDCPICAS